MLSKLSDISKFWKCLLLKCNQSTIFLEIGDIFLKKNLFKGYNYDIVVKGVSVMKGEERCQLIV